MKVPKISKNSSLGEITMEISKKLSEEIIKAIDASASKIQFDLDEMERSGELPIELWRKIRPMLSVASNNASQRVLTLIRSNGRNV